jgi:hypothetical protein
MVSNFAVLSPITIPIAKIGSLGRTFECPPGSFLILWKILALLGSDAAGASGSVLEPEKQHGAGG